MTSVAGLYSDACKSHSVKVNSKVIADLRKSGETADKIKIWDLRDTMIGTKGAIVVMEVVKEHLHQLEVIDLRGSNIQSAFTKVLLNSAVGHNNLKAINLADNDIRLGGSELIELVKKNHKVAEINIANTHLRNLFVRVLEHQLKKNATEHGVMDFVFSEKDSKSEKAFCTNTDEAGGGWGGAFGFGDPSSDKEENDEDDKSSNGSKKVAFDAEGGEEQPYSPTKRRTTVFSEVYADDQIDNYEAPTYEKSEESLAWLISVLEKHDFFSYLEDHDIAVAANAMPDAVRGVDSVLFEEGDDDGDTWYLVGEGKIELRKEGEVVKTLSKGDATQDLALLYPQVALETAVCTESSITFTLDRRTYRFITSQASKKKREMYEGFLSTVGFLKAANLGRNELLQLADSLKSATFEDGGVLIQYGEIGEAFFIVLEGKVDVFGRDDDGGVVKVCEFTEGACVGELEFINNHRCVADVKANGSVRVAKMNRRHFEMVMGPVKEILARHAGESLEYTYYRQQLEKMENVNGKSKSEKKEDEDENKEL